MVRARAESAPSYAAEHDAEHGAGNGVSWRDGSRTGNGRDADWITAKDLTCGGSFGDLHEWLAGWHD